MYLEAVLWIRNDNFFSNSFRIQAVRIRKKIFRIRFWQKISGSTTLSRGAAQSGTEFLALLLAFTALIKKFTELF
jgi:hypothetical protein